MSEPNKDVDVNAGIKFLQRKFKLSNAPEVSSSAKRQAERSGVAIAEYDYVSLIQNYFNRLNNIVSYPEKGERNLQLLENRLFDKIIIKPEEIPETYWQSIIQRHQDEGRPIEDIPEQTKKELADTLIADQKQSLDIWLNYLSSKDAKYPDWFKYYVLKNILTMGRYDKGNKKFFERGKTKKSVSQFPELIRDALAFVCDALEAKQKGNLGSLKYGHGIKPEEKAEFEKLLNQGEDPNFARLYAWSIDKITPISEELLQETKGQWIKYPKGSDSKAVVNALAQYGTGWCIRGEGTAQTYLKDSDLEIYFSKDKNGQPAIPRIVIVTRNDRIDEVRGIAKEEHLDPYITNIVENKLAELPDGQKFQKRVADMKQMTVIHHKSFSVDKQTGVKTYLSPSLTKEELFFLYEAESKIEGFGYNIPDPRIKEVRDKRSTEEDILIIFNCEKNQIARNLKEINQNTKAYVGPLEKDIFNLFLKYKIQHIYTSFPEGKIRLDNILIGGKKVQQLEKEIKQIGKITNFAKKMLYNRDFTTLKDPTLLGIVYLKESDLGLSKYPINQIYQRAQELGLDLCPAEVGAHLLLKDKNPLIERYLFIGMKQISIADSGGDPPRIFMLVRGDNGLWLYGTWVEPARKWYPAHVFVFSLRKPV